MDNTQAISELVQELDQVALMVASTTVEAADAVRRGEHDQAMGILAGMNTLLADALALHQSAVRLNARRHSTGCVRV